MGTRIRISGTILVLVASAAWAQSPGAPNAYSFRTLRPPPGYISTSAVAVSSDGRYVAGNLDADGGGQAFLWDGTTLVPLGALPGGLGSGPVAVSSTGVVIGTSWPRGFYWTAQTGMHPLSDLCGTDASPVGISADGSVIVGYDWRWTAADGLKSIAGAGPFSDSQALGVSADGRVAVGQSSQGAVYWTAAEQWVAIGDVPGGPDQSAARAANVDGSVIVGGGASEYGIEPARWTRQTGMIGLARPTVPGGEAAATGVTADGSVVVGWYERDGSTAFFWTESAGARPLRDVLVGDYGLDVGDWQLSMATGISADGRTIVGVATAPDGHDEAFVAVVPEPAIVPACIAGVLLLVRRRK